ncbi:MAG: cytochrome ubiquinol oxidase subunit I, partial [Pantoea sp.]|nr:cytochrome ubiquinol oxidase subunit I [Pantoea sp.]
MFGLDAFHLARIQFAFTVSFHIIFPAITIGLASAFFVGSSAAWHLLKGKKNPAIRKMFSMAMWMALIVAPIQAMIGDAHGLNTLEHQPAKIAAI